MALGQNLCAPARTGMKELEPDSDGAAQVLPGGR